MTEARPTIIYTIGHSNHPAEDFSALLKAHNIVTVADVRSNPFSTYNPQFNQGQLKSSLRRSGIEYVYLGKELGGHPGADHLYDKGGHVIYERISGTPEFRQGIRKVAELAVKDRLVLMCAEGDPAKCHRHPLLARFLLERGFRVDHVQRDGSLTQADTMFNRPADPQLPLFEPPGEDLSWRSPKRIR